VGAKSCAQQGKASGQLVTSLGGLPRRNGPWIPGGVVRHRSRAQPVANREQGGADAGPCNSEGKRGRKQAPDTWGCHGARVRCVACGGPG
jgi:hypothetical protein